MKKILGLDLGTSSIGWAIVNEAENDIEKSEIIKLGVRVNPLTVDEQKNFELGKSITTNADRTIKRCARRNLQRYKLRRNELISVLKEHSLINDETILCENGNNTTFETYRLRAKAVIDKVSLEEFARILLMINKKRGYKSSRKSKNQEEGKLIDGMAVAMSLYEENLTPSQFIINLLSKGKRYIPDFYRSDLQLELDKIWECQKQFYPELLTDELKEQILNKGKQNTSKIFLSKFGIYTSQNKAKDKRLQSYQWRVDALQKQLSKEEVAFVISDVNGNIYNSSGYLGGISDRSKELFFNKQTVGQYLMSKLNTSPNYSFKNQIFYRQDYLDEFNAIWETQANYHKELTNELKSEIRDIIIFYQRRLKSQKGLISFCEFESKKIEVDVEGKKKIKNIGLKVCPKSSPLFQEFKIWQILNNVEVLNKDSHDKRLLNQEEKDLLYKELTFKVKMTKDQVLKLLFNNPKELDLNYKELDGNRTMAAFFEACQNIIELSGHGEYDFSKMNSDAILDLVKPVFRALKCNVEILSFNSELQGQLFEKQAFYKLWHLVYSFEGDNSNTGNEKLINKIAEQFGFEKEFATIISNINLQPDYGSLSSKAIRKILPFLKAGNEYSLACEYAGYKHSKNSLTKEEINNKFFKPRIEILPKNSLRNPVVEKILNQMINVVNAATDCYGKPDEIRIELARELKKSAKEREDMTKAINNSTAEHEKIKDLLKKEYGFSHVSRNDIIRYKLYKELEPNGYKTLYSNSYISQEKLFSKEFDIEHIIPQSRLFDDSFSNKTIELRSVNIEKGNKTANDYVLEKYKDNSDYLNRIKILDKDGSRAKYKKLIMKESDIPSDFINRDLRDTQYIAKKAKELLEEIIKTVVSTSGSITDRLREDWQLIDVMQELNWDKYHKLGLTEIIENKDGHKIRRIKDWTKRNDHRHHAMDALTIAFTKPSHIQYLNNLNAKNDKSSSIYGIEKNELSKDHNGKLRFKPPIPLNDFRFEAKKHLESVLVSIKAKNKVVTKNCNITKKKNGINKKTQLTPRGQLHNETVYGCIKQYVSKYEKVAANLTEELIAKVANKKIREALLTRLKANDNDPKKAFTGKNSLDANPIYLDSAQTHKMPEKVKIVSYEDVYTIRKDIGPELNVEKVIDVKVKNILLERLNSFNNDPKKAFVDLEENPIWLNKEKAIAIKRVTISGISNAIPLHEKKDKFGKFIIDSDGNCQPTDFVSTSNNHHVAIYKDDKGNLQENVVSFFEATQRASIGLPSIDKEYKQSEGWQFLFSMKQNEYFVFPNEKTGFNPHDIDLLNPDNYNFISPNLFRVQKISTKNYLFCHHLETRSISGEMLKTQKQLAGITYYFIQSLPPIKDIVKVRINHIGEITNIGEY